MITIDLDKLELISEKSHYNANYYRYPHGNSKTEILVVSDEYYSTDSVHLVKGDCMIFMGTCYNFDGSSLLKINLGEEIL